MGLGVLASSVTVGGFDWVGDLTTLDLIAASTNALNGALLARPPDHYKNLTVMGVMVMAVLGGIGGGVTRDVILNQMPAALKNPAYLVLCSRCTRSSAPRRRSRPACRCWCAAARRDRPDRWTLVHRCLQQGGAEAVHPGRVVRRDRRVHRRHLAGLLRSGSQHLVVRPLRARGRLHRARDRAVPCLGGTASEGTRRRLPALRRPAHARPQAHGQVAARAARPRTGVEQASSSTEP